MQHVRIALFWLSGWLSVSSLLAQKADVQLIQEKDVRMIVVDQAERPDGGFYAWQQVDLFLDAAPLQLVRYDAEGRPQAQVELTPHLRGRTVFSNTIKILRKVHYRGYWQGQLLEIYSPAEDGEGTKVLVQKRDPESLKLLGKPKKLDLSPNNLLLHPRGNLFQAVSLESGKAISQLFSPRWESLKKTALDLKAAQEYVIESVCWLDNGDVALSVLSFQASQPSLEVMYLPFASGEAAQVYELSSSDRSLTKVALVRANPARITAVGFFLEKANQAISPPPSFSANGFMTFSFDLSTGEVSSQSHLFKILFPDINKRNLKGFDNNIWPLRLVYADSVSDTQDAIVIEYALGTNLLSPETPIYLTTMAVGLDTEGQLTWHHAWDEKRPTSDKEGRMGSTLVFAHQRALHLILNQKPQLWHNSDILWRSIDEQGQLSERVAAELSDSDYGFKPTGSAVLTDGRLLFTYRKRNNYKLKLGEIKP
jgi:hypothetical protein